jgi:hypothetical protein
MQVSHVDSFSPPCFYQYTFSGADVVDYCFFWKPTKRFILMVIGANGNNLDVQRFLLSFALTETNVDSQASRVIIDVPSNSSDIERVRTASPPEPWFRSAGPILGGVLMAKRQTSWYLNIPSKLEAQMNPARLR